MAPRIQRALITGASAGIGEAFARALAERGVALTLVARRRERLTALAEQLPVETEVLAADLLDAGQRAAVEGRLISPDRPIDLLVNSAGLGAYGPFAQLDPGRAEELIACNALALTRLTGAALEQQLVRDRGGVINVGSTAGYQPNPGGAVYGATKAYVRSLTEALTEEVRGTGVQVMLCSPGFTETEFQRVADVPAGAVPRPARMGPQAVAEAALRDFAAGRATSVPGGVNRVTVLGSQLTPSAVTRRVSGLVHRRFSESS